LIEVFTCENILGAGEAIIGAINEVAGGVFGVLSLFCE
jgi:hypothetical protein